MIPHVTKITHAYEMWEALTKLFQSGNENKKMVPREKLHSMKMSRGESITSYLTRVTQVQDELAAVGEKIKDTEFLWLTLKVFSKPWC